MAMPLKCAKGGIRFFKWQAVRQELPVAPSREKVGATTILQIAVMGRQLSRDKPRGDKPRGGNVAVYVQTSNCVANIAVPPVWLQDSCLKIISISVYIADERRGAKHP